MELISSTAKEKKMQKTTLLKKKIAFLAESLGMSTSFV